jgi:hypothetical protein
MLSPLPAQEAWNSDPPGLFTSQSMHPGGPGDPFIRDVFVKFLVSWTLAWVSCHTLLPQVKATL